MTKIKIPANLLIGTPLSEDELKSIVGGYVHKTECTCTYHLIGKPATTGTVNAVTSTDCKNECNRVCGLNSECASVGYTFSETYSSEG